MFYSVCRVTAIPVTLSLLMMTGRNRTPVKTETIDSRSQKTSQKWKKNKRRRLADGELGLDIYQMRQAPAAKGLRYVDS